MTPVIVTALAKVTLCASKSANVRDDSDNVMTLPTSLKTTQKYLHLNRSALSNQYFKIFN
jgi:hypothetical protein